MKKIRFIILLAVGHLSLNAQNLVTNGDFELFTNCPGGKGEIYYPGSSIEHSQTLMNWYSPTSGTPDYFNTCNTSNFEISIPKNFLGNEKPHSGNGFSGLVLYTEELPNCFECKEYIQIRLKEVLKKGATYKVSCFISLADNVKYAVNEIGIYLSSDSIFNRAPMTLKYVPQVYNSSPDQMKISNGWSSIEGNYIAKGNELYLTIGNFIPSFKTEVTIVGKKKEFPSSYYFIDDVSLTLISAPHDSVPKSVQTTIDSVKVGAVFILNNIQFQPLKAELQKESLSELEKVTDWLTKKPQLKIEIGGYTDNSGAEKENLKLSELRAKAVYDHLVSKGVTPKNLTYRGYGSMNPVADNNSAEGREKNRRVEIKVIQ